MSLTALGSNYLNGIQLPAQLIWAEQYSSQRVAGTILPTLDGGVLAYSQQLQYKNFTIEAREDTDWFDQTMVDAFLVMAETPNAQYSLVWNGSTYTVIFRHNEPPVADFTPIFPFEVNYTGRLKLLAIQGA